MKTSGLLLVAVSSVAILAGCSGTKQTKYTLESSADQCTMLVNLDSSGKNGKTTLKALRKIDSLYVRVGDSTEQTLIINDLPYVESEILDNGKPGSAWRQCMQEKGYTISPKS